MSVEFGGNIVVTGANRGIGLELVRQLVQDSDHVYACCREPEGPRAEALRALAACHPGKISLIRLNVTDEDSVYAAIHTVSEQVGTAGLNLLINNAAINAPPSPATLSSTSKKDMMDVFETNVTGPFLLAKMCLPLLQRAAENQSSGKGDEMSCKRSAIINVSTLISSIENCPETFHMAQMYPYRVSKAALNMLTRCLAVDYSKHSILVTGIHPGWVRTDMGGQEAPLSAHDSVRKMLAVMSSLRNKDSGLLLSWEGTRIPW
ncbi:C-factor [Thalassophryne amazonica]|uniref:C-factor n=1 Tax=Thalassophryne amazonica TaxID=390379 RepID=UPI0014725974|nr:C-factor [Thalassophryne amazonica]